MSTESPGHPVASSDLFVQVRDRFTLALAAEFKQGLAVAQDRDLEAAFSIIDKMIRIRECLRDLHALIEQWETIEPAPAAEPDTVALQGDSVAPQETATVEAPAPELTAEQLEPCAPQPESALAAAAQTPPLAPPERLAPLRKRSGADRDILRRKQEFYDQAREIEAQPDRPATMARIKSAVCLGKALVIAIGTDPEADVLGDEIRGLREQYERMKGPVFFGFKPRALTPETWAEAAEAYLLLAEAERGFEYMQSHSADLDASMRTKLFTAIAAAETLVHRLLDERSIQSWDKQQTDLNAKLKDAQPSGAYVPWWKSADNGGPSTKEVLEAAKGLPKLINQAIEGPTRERRKRMALVRLQQRIKEPLKPGEDFEAELCVCAKECLAAGLTPNKKELVGLLFEFRGVLEDAGDPELSRLIEALRKEATLAVRRAARSEPERPIDAETVERISCLRKLLEGKVVLFVGGGNKGDKGRRQAIEDALGLAELIWPDTEENTSISFFEPLVKRADLVCKVVKHSRHGDRQVLNDAKSQGKMTASIIAGTGIPTVVRDLHNQLHRE